MYEKQKDQHNCCFIKIRYGRRYHTDFSGKIVVVRLQATTITNDKYMIIAVPVHTPHTVSHVSISHFKPVLSYVKHMNVGTDDGCCCCCCMFLFCFVDLNSKQFIRVWFSLIFLLSLDGACALCRNFIMLRLNTTIHGFHNKRSYCVCYRAHLHRVWAMFESAVNPKAWFKTPP